MQTTFHLSLLQTTLQGVTVHADHVPLVTITNNATGGDSTRRPRSTHARPSSQAPGSEDADSEMLLSFGKLLKCPHYSVNQERFLPPVSGVVFSTALPTLWMTAPSSDSCLILCLCLAITGVSRTGCS